MDPSKAKFKSKIQKSKQKKKKNTHTTERLETYKETLGTSLEHEHHTEETQKEAMNRQGVQGRH